MKNLHNIEKSGSRKGEYTGYANGAWRILKRSAKLGWRADKNGSPVSIYGKTLAEISEKLFEISEKSMTKNGVSAMPNPFESV